MLANVRVKSVKRIRIDLSLRCQHFPFFIDHLQTTYLAEQLCSFVDSISFCAETSKRTRSHCHELPVRPSWLSSFLSNMTLQVRENAPVYSLCEKNLKQGSNGRRHLSALSDR